MSAYWRGLLDETQTSFASLCAFGHYPSREKALEPLQRVEVPQKTVRYSPQEKLIDSVIGMLAGCEALYEINTKVRPDLPLRRAFGKEDGPADQSVIRQTFNAFDERTVGQLREALEEIHRRYSKVYSHDFEEEPSIVEVDLTGLTASKGSEGSTKGYFAGKSNNTGRRLARVMAPRYQEIVFEKLYTGDTNSSEVLKEVLKEGERLLGLEDDKYRRKRTLIRIDGGFGTDENLNRLCWRGYQSIAKGYTRVGERKKQQEASPRRTGKKDPH